MVIMYLYVLAVLGIIMLSQAQLKNYSTSALMPSRYQLNITYLMKEKI